MDGGSRASASAPISTTTTTSQPVCARAVAAGSERTRRAATGLTPAARLAGSIEATSVITTPDDETRGEHDRRDGRAVHVGGARRPGATPPRPRRARRPGRGRATDPANPSTSAWARTTRTTWPRPAPAARSSASSRTRSTTVIARVLRIRNAAANRAIAAIRAIVARRSAVDARIESPMSPGRGQHVRLDHEALPIGGDDGLRVGAGGEHHVHPRDPGRDRRSATRRRRPPRCRRAAVTIGQDDRPARPARPPGPSPARTPTTVAWTGAPAPKITRSLPTSSPSAAARRSVISAASWSIAGQRRAPGQGEVVDARLADRVDAQDGDRLRGGRAAGLGADEAAPLDGRCRERHAGDGVERGGRRGREPGLRERRDAQVRAPDDRLRRSGRSTRPSPPRRRAPPRAPPRRSRRR